MNKEFAEEELLKNRDNLLNQKFEFKSSTNKNIIEVIHLAIIQISNDENGFCVMCACEDKNSLAKDNLLVFELNWLKSNTTKV